VLTYKSGCWRGLGGGGGPFWLHKETLTFKSPAAQQTCTVYRIEVNRIPPSFDMLFATLYGLFDKFKELTVQPIYGLFSSERLNTCHSKCSTISHSGYLTFAAGEATST